VTGQNVQAIGLDGNLIIDGNVVDSTGVTRWSTDAGLLTPTIDANGTVYSLVAGEIAGADFHTGATRWTLAAPMAATQVFDSRGDPLPNRDASDGLWYCDGGVTSAVLTSTGAIIALTCSGGLFGASD
jgi:hypothetical protein